MAFLFKELQPNFYKMTIDDLINAYNIIMEVRELNPNIPPYLFKLFYELSGIHLDKISDLLKLALHINNILCERSAESGIKLIEDTYLNSILYLKDETQLERENVHLISRK